MEFVLKADEKFRYMMLDRLRGDCEYYLGNGNRSSNVLWSEDERQHIENMKAIYNTFGEKDKPEWLTWEQILDYERRMIKIEEPGSD